MDFYVAVLLYKLEEAAGGVETPDEWAALAALAMHAHGFLVGSSSSSKTMTTPFKTDLLNVSALTVPEPSLYYPSDETSSGYDASESSVGDDGAEESSSTLSCAPPRRTPSKTTTPCQRSPFKVIANIDFLVEKTNALRISKSNTASKVVPNKSRYHFVKKNENEENDDENGQFYEI